MKGAKSEKIRVDNTTVIEVGGGAERSKTKGRGHPKKVSL